MYKERVFGNLLNVSLPYEVTAKQNGNLGYSPVSNGTANKKNFWRSFEVNGEETKGRMFGNYGDHSSGYGGGYKPPPKVDYFPYNQAMYPATTAFRSRLYPHGNNYIPVATSHVSFNQENMNRGSPWSNPIPVKSLTNGVNFNYNSTPKTRPVLAEYDDNIQGSRTDAVNTTVEYSVHTTSKYSVNSYYSREQPKEAPAVAFLKRNGDVTPLTASQQYYPTSASNGSLSGSYVTGMPFRSNTTSNVEMNSTMTNGVVPSQPTQPVELHVTNLDQSIDEAEMKNVLHSLFREHAKVLHLSVFVQSDGSHAASVKVATVQDAQYVISRLHRRKIGFKRITISYAHSNSTHNSALIRSQIISLLLDVPGHQLPLFKFMELFEKRYLTTASLSDLYKMKDVCIITDDSSSAGRVITLHPDHRISPNFITNSAMDMCYPPEQPFCTRHWKKAKIACDKGWAEFEISALPNVSIKLTEFSNKMRTLLRSHNNYLLLASLCDCYEAEFQQTLPYASEENGVPLEHLVTCMSGIELVQNPNTGIKYLTACNVTQTVVAANDVEKKLEDGQAAGTSLANSLALFSRELVDLLKTFPRCMLSFYRFIPAYHHHFGRQCRVADYGYTKLIDLLEAMPHVVQVLGEGNRRIVTLSHKAQVRRFTSDLLRVLKSVANKQATVTEFPALYEKMLNRPFNPIDYGLADLHDLLSQVSDLTVLISRNGAEETVIAIPKREQTADEMERTRIFATEVVELLSHTPGCSMLFNKFVPSYHHHYGHQCRVSDFGFTKLIELFKAIPEVVEIEDEVESGDRRVTLQHDVKLKVLGEQLANLVMAYHPAGLLYSDLCAAYLWKYGYALKPSTYGFSNIDDVIRNITSSVKVLKTQSGLILQAVDKKQLRFLRLRVFRVLIEKSKIGRMPYGEFSSTFSSIFGSSCTLQQLIEELSDVVKVLKDNESGEVDIVQLIPVYLFARDTYHMLMNMGGSVSLNAFEMTYLRLYGTAIQPAVYGHQTIVSLLEAIPDIVQLRGKPPKRYAILNNELSSVGLPVQRNPLLYYNSGSFSRGSSRSSSTSRSASVEEASSTSSTVSCRQNGDEEFACNSKKIDNSDNDKFPIVEMPDLVLHPDTFTSSPLISPHKSLQDSVMYAEHMLHAPSSSVVAPPASTLPHIPRLQLNNPDTTYYHTLGTTFQDRRKIRLAANFPSAS